MVIIYVRHMQLISSYLMLLNLCSQQMDTFYPEAFGVINRDGSKLFAKLKTDIGMAKYLTHSRDIDSRIALGKIRLSNHDLMIERD